MATEARSSGRKKKLQVSYHYLAFNKPYRVMSCFNDSEGRVTLRNYIPVAELDAAGRLDYESEGLMILSNDGDLLHRLTHPHYEHSKTYLVQVEGMPAEAALEALRRGVVIQGICTRPAEVELLVGEREPAVPTRPVPIDRAGVLTAWLKVVLREGRKRQLRHMTAAVGHPTLRLIRIAIGPVALGDLKPGAWRNLTPGELLALGVAPDDATPAGEEASGGDAPQTAARRPAKRGRRESPPHR